MTFEIVMRNPRKQDVGEPLGGTSVVGHLVWLQTSLELFFLPLLESLIAHMHCILGSMGVVDIRMHDRDTQIHTLAHTQMP